VEGPRQDPNNESGNGAWVLGSNWQYSADYQYAQFTDNKLYVAVPEGYAQNPVSTMTIYNYYNMGTLKSITFYVNVPDSTESGN
jgi:hypothetical protein